MRDELLPTECELCDCEQFDGYGHKCRCGHPAYRHIFRYRQRYPRK